MASSSHRETRSSSSYRFYEYLNCLQEEFERRSNDDMSTSLRHFNIYLGNLKSEFELKTLEIESLRNERVEYEERVEELKKLQDARLNFVCGRCNIGTASAPQIAVSSPEPKAIIADPSLFPENSLNTPGKSEEPDLHPLPHSVRKERGWSIEFNSKVEKKFNIEIALTFFHEGTVECVKFSRDGKYLAAGCEDGKAYIYDIQKGTVFRVLRNLLVKKNHISAVCFSTDGKYLATDVLDGLGAILIWEINTKYVRSAFKGHIRRINSLNFSPNGRLLVSTSDDNTIRVWNMRDGATKLLAEENPTILDCPCYSSAIFSPDGMYVAAPHRDGMVRIWDVYTGRLTRRIEAHLPWATSVAFMPDGKRLVSGGWDHKLRYWDVGSFDSTQFNETTKNSQLGVEEEPEITEGLLVGKQAFIYSISTSPDGRWVASSSSDRTVRIWDSRIAATQCTLSLDDEIWTVDFSPVGRCLASGGKGGSLRIWKYSSVASAESCGG